MATWSNETKPSTTWTNQTKPSTDLEYLVSEALDFLMTEDNQYLITNQSITWTNETKPI